MATHPLASTARLGAILLALACAASAARADEVDVRLRRNPDKTYEVSGLFDAAASTATVWSVLADYEGIPGFVYSMRSSRVKEARADGTVILVQEAVGGLFFVSRKVRVVLEVRRAPGRLDFTDIGGEDFFSYSGSWETQATREGTLVTYHLVAEPRFPAPGFVMKGVMRRGARNLLEQVRDEILRRRDKERAAPPPRAAPMDALVEKR
jgi:hypothetical protein